MPLPTTDIVTRPQSFGYGARLNDLLVRLVGNAEVGPAIRSAQSEAPRVNTSENPEDFVGQIGQTFSRAEFHGGEGQGFANREGAAPNRYWDSKGIDISPPQPGRPASARLLSATESIRAATDTNLHLATDGDSLWIAEDTTLFRTDDPTSATPGFSADDPHNAEPATTVLGLTFLGDELYAALGTNGIHRRDNTGSWAHWSDLEADGIWAIKRRIIASEGGELYEAADGVNSTLLLTLPPGFVFTDVVDGGTHILAAATDSHIYAFTVNEDTGDLSLATQTPIPAEEPVSLANLSATILIGTRRSTGDGHIGRLWRGVAREDGTLTDLTLVRQWGHGDDLDDTEDHSPSALMVDKDQAFLGVEEHTPSDTHLWRYDFSTGGRSRHIDGLGDGRIISIVSLEERLFFSVAGVGLIREDLSQHVASSYLITPLADFFTSLSKSWSEVAVDALVESGQSVELYYTIDPEAIRDPDSMAWIHVLTVEGEQIGGDTTRLHNVRSRYLALMVKLFPAPSLTTTPNLRSVSATGVVEQEEIVVQLTVNVSDQIELPGRRRHNVYGLGEKVFRRLMRLQSRPVELELFRPHQRIRGQVRSVSARMPSVSANGSRMDVSTVEVLGRAVPIGVSFAGQGAMGVGMMGHMTMGGVDD